MRVTIQMDISDEFIGNVIDTAGYGIGYWVSAAVWDEDGKTYTITDAESGEVFVITYRRIGKAIEQLLAGKSNVHDGIIDSLRKAVTQDHAAHVDADVADIIIQYAIFGEMVYG